MDVHVGSLMPRAKDARATSSIVLVGPADPTTLEVSGSGAKIPMGVSGAEIPMGVCWETFLFRRSSKNVTNILFSVI